MTASEFFGWGAAIFIGYAVLSRGLFLATDGARQSLIDLGGSLIDSPGVAQAEKDDIVESMGSAHSAICAWRLVGVALRVMFTIPFARDNGRVPVPAMAREAYFSFISRWIVATIGNSLGAAIIFSFLFLITAALRVSFQKFSRALLVRRHHHDGDHATA